MPVELLTHHSAEYVTWAYEELHFALLGGIRIEGLHSMRVTLKVDFARSSGSRFPSIRHGLDLYNETQTQKLVKSIAERFTLSSDYVHTAIGELINTVEAYRLQQLDKSIKTQVSGIKTLSAAETEAAVSFLKAPDLLGRTNELIGQSGVIGEEQNRLIMYLVFSSRKTSRPLHIISMGSSGTGKSHLQEKVGALIPEEDKIELTSVSGNAFYYYVDDDLGHKLILIEDYDGVFAALYPIRELQSKQQISKTITSRDRNGHTRTLHLKVKGPVSIGGCTTSEHIYEDNANRSFLICLDESEAQDERIMAYQRAVSAGRIDRAAQYAVQQRLQNVQRVLQPISVRNPYAESLIIPKEVFKPRRSNAHYIAFIEAITFYKQYQRPHQADPETGEVFIESSLEDIAEANELMKHILLKKADELGYASRHFLERLAQQLRASGEDTFSNKDMRAALQTAPGTYKMYLSELISYGYVTRTGEGNQKQGYRYALTNAEAYSQLQSRIHNELDSILSRLQAGAVPVPKKGAGAKGKAVAADGSGC